jgi:hypothetical protein
MNIVERLESLGAQYIHNQGGFYGLLYKDNAIQVPCYTINNIVRNAINVDESLVDFLNSKVN